VIWKRTPAGQAELKTHAAGLRAAAQNLLMVLDGAKTEEMLLANLVGITREDFRSLAQQGLIEPVVAAGSVSGAQAAIPQALPATASTGTGRDGQFAAVLADVINTSLGLAGFRLLNACENATTTAELHELARMAIDLIHQRKGSAAAQDVRVRLQRSATNFRA